MSIEHLWNAEILTYNRDSVMRFFTHFWEKFDDPKWSWHGAHDALFNFNSKHAVYSGDTKQQVDPFNRVEDLQTFALSVARNTSEFPWLNLKESELWFTGAHKNGIDKDYAGRTHEVLRKIWKAWWIDWIRAFLLRDAWAIDTSWSIQEEEEIDQENKDEFMEQLYDLNNLENELQKEILEEWPTQENLAIGRELAEHKHMIEEIVLENTIVHKVYTKEEVTGYTKLVIERVYVDYEKVINELENISPDWSSKIHTTAMSSYDAFVATSVWQERLRKLEKEGRMSRSEAEEILQKQCAIETLHTYTSSLDEDDPYYEDAQAFKQYLQDSDNPALQDALEVFDKTYTYWYDGTLNIWALVWAYAWSLQDYKVSPLVKQLQGHLDTNSALLEYIQTPATKTVAVSSKDYIASLYTKDELIDVYNHMQWVNKKIVDWSFMQKDIDDMKQFLLEKSDVYEGWLSSYIEPQLRRSALTYSTYYIQHMFWSSVGTDGPLYEDDSIDFSFDDMDIQDGAVIKNSLMYQWRELGYSIDDAWCIVIDDPSVHTADGSHICIWKTYRWPSLWHIMDCLLDISRDMSALLTAEDIDVYIQQNIDAALQGIQEDFLVYESYAHDFRRDIEAYTCFEHIQTRNIQKNESGEILANMDDAKEIQSFCETLYAWVNGKYFSMENYVEINALLSSYPFETFLAWLDVGMREFLKDAWLVGQKSAFFVSSVDTCMEWWRLLERYIYASDKEQSFSALNNFSQRIYGSQSGFWSKYTLESSAICHKK